MNGFLLVTNVISEFKKPTASDFRVANWLRNTNADLIWASVLSLGEIQKGIQRLPTGKRRTQLELWLEYDLELWFEQRLIPVTSPLPSAGVY